MAYKYLMACLKNLFDDLDKDSNNISKILPSLKVFFKYFIFFLRLFLGNGIYY